MHLVDDVYLVLPYLGRNAYLVYQRADVFYRVVRGCIQLVYVVGTLFVECLAGFAPVAGLAVGRWRQAVDGLGEDACAGGFSHTAWTAEQVGMSQLAVGDGILEGGSQGALSHHRVEGAGTVFAGRYYIVFHRRILFIVLVPANVHN